jgi:hypothetical protein
VTACDLCDLCGFGYKTGGLSSSSAVPDELNEVIKDEDLKVEFLGKCGNPGESPGRHCFQDLCGSLHNLLNAMKTNKFFEAICNMTSSEGANCQQLLGLVKTWQGRICKTDS